MRRTNSHSHPRRMVEALEPRRMLAADLLDNVPITTDPGVQQMPSVAADPTTPGRLAAAYLDYSLVSTGYAGVAVATSTDGGDTWEHASIPLPAGFDEAAAHPIAKFDDQGRLYVAFMAGRFLGHKPPINDPTGTNPDTGQRFRADGFLSSNGLFVARSDDGGVRWNAPVAVASHVCDGSTPVPYDIMPDLAVDANPSSPNYGNLYVLWVRFYPPGQFPGEPESTGGSAMRIAVSGDGGTSFQARPAISDTLNSGTGPLPGQGVANWPRVAVGADGQVYVAYYDFGNFFVIDSGDAAQSFDAVTAADVQGGVHALFGTDGTAADPIAGGSLLRLAGFRTSPSRAIVADPNQPGTVYAADFIATFDALGNEIDSDVLFARSEDDGRTWSRLRIDGQPVAVNDDDLGAAVTGSESDVGARQFLVRLAADPGGAVVAVWYDTRRDPSKEDLDVFAAISTDGGRSFGPNFRVTDRRFDVEAGRFSDARGNDNYHLGDFLGVAAVNGTAYVAWTDTRAGNQDVFFSTFSLTAPPPPDNDRYEPNDDAPAATDLGPVVRRTVPKLHILPGDADVFTFETRASGTLEVTATQADPGKRVTLEVLDENGAVLAAGEPLRDGDDGGGTVIGERLVVPSRSGQRFTLRVSPAGGAGTGTGYALELQALTADLGTVAYDLADGAVAAGEQNYFRFTAAASGSVALALAPATGADPASDLVLEVLDARTLEVLATGTPADAATTITVTAGQTFIARVGADGGSAGGAFTLGVTNLDPFATADRAALLFPAGDGPSQIASGDVDNDGFADLLVTNGLSNTLSVLLANGDGTFQSPRQFAVGSFRAGTLGGLIPTFKRDLVLGDFDRDGNLDAAVTNLNSSDVSILLGRGDGTFRPQRRFDATATPFAIDAGDLNGDGFLDLAVIDTSVDELKVAVLIGRGDGTFRSQVLVPTGLPGTLGNVTMALRIADVNNDAHGDLIYTGSLDAQSYVRLGAGDGVTFADAVPAAGAGPGMAVADLNGDGNPDLVNTTYFTNEVTFVLGNGDGTFSEPRAFFGGQSPVDVQVADVGSLNPDGSLGAADGIPDVITVASGAPQATFQGPGQVTVSPGFIGDDGGIAYGDGMPLANGTAPLGLALADVDGNGSAEIAFVDVDGVRLIFGRRHDVPANVTRDAARDLGTVVHLLQPTLTLTPGREEAWYALTVPTEAARGGGDEVIDFSGLFEHTRGAGLGMEVLDASGRVLGSGEHVRVVAKQGQRLLARVFGKTADDGTRGAGAYTLDVAVLPQLLSVEAPPLLPGPGGRPAGPTASLVLTFQGDRLDQAAAEDPANYRVTWLGVDGRAGTADDRVIPLGGNGSGGGADKPVVYNPSANVDISTGREYATAVRQTVTLAFDDALPAGAYRVELSPAIGTEHFNEAEAALLPAGRQVLVTLRSGRVTDGADVRVARLVRPAETGADIDLAAFASGTPFLSQLHGDLGALLDQQLTDAGDQPGITGALLRQILGRLRAGLGDAASMLAVFLDPVGLDLADPTGARLAYDLKSGGLENEISGAYFSVASNIELVVIPLAAGEFTLNVDDVPATARGGVVILDGGGASSELLFLTDRLRAAERTFEFSINPRSTPPPADPRDGGGSSAGGDVDLLLPSSLTRRAADVVTNATVTAAAFMLSSDDTRDDGGGSGAALTRRDAAAGSAAAPSGDGDRGASIAEGNGEMNGGSDEPTGEPGRAETSPRDVAEQLQKLMNTLPGVIHGVPAEPPAPNGDAPPQPPAKEDGRQPSGRGDAEGDDHAGTGSSRLPAAERRGRDTRSSSPATPNRDERSDAGPQSVAPTAGPQSRGAELPLVSQALAAALLPAPRTAIRWAVTRPKAPGGRRRGGAA